jgi:hypothetical protein
VEPDGTLVKLTLKLPKHVSQFVSAFRPGQPETDEERAHRAQYWREHPFPTIGYRPEPT